jgi:hypothetical protein
MTRARWLTPHGPPTARASHDDPAWADERNVRLVLMKHGVEGVEEIPVEEFAFVAAQIAQFKRKPVTVEGIEKLKQDARWQRTRRQGLDRAADLLNRERAEYRKLGWREHERRWEEAIAVLRMPRGVFDNPNDWLRDLNNHGITPWDYMASTIVCTLFHALVPYGVIPPLVVGWRNSFVRR